MSELRFVDACTEAHFEAMSLIHALGWRDSYVGYVPDDYLKTVITDQRWVPYFRQDYAAKRCNGLLLYNYDVPVVCGNYGPARGQEPGCEGWGEILSFYAHPHHRGHGYGGLLIEEMAARLKADGYQNAYVYVLRENEDARRFYASHGFSWDGTHTSIPFPPDAVCVDLRYTRAL